MMSGGGVVGAEFASMLIDMGSEVTVLEALPRILATTDVEVGSVVARSFKKRGVCHVFGDGVPHDEGVMAFKYAIERVTDPKLLIPHLFEQVDPSFAKRVKPGDIVVAGKDFCQGKPHTQGYIAMTALGMAVLCESMPHKSLRRAVAIGLPVLTGCDWADPSLTAPA